MVKGEGGRGKGEEGKRKVMEVMDVPSCSWLVIVMPVGEVSDFVSVRWCR